MRLHRLWLTNFRAITEREVTFHDTGVNVVVGANEAGKSSMVEALDLLLEVPAHSKKQRVRAITPSGQDVGTTIEAEISCGAYKFVLSKTFNRASATELSILRPTPQQLRGAVAHEKVQAILQESVDLGLWAALRLLQGATDGQAELTGSAALARALDAAGGTTSQAGGLSPIVDAAREEYARYYTAAQGRPTGELAAAEQELADAQATTEATQAAVDEVRGKADRLDQLLVTSREQANAAEQDAVLREDLEQRAALLEEVERELAAARQRAQACSAEVGYRRRDLADRTHYRQELAVADSAIERSRTQLESLADDLKQLEGQRVSLVEQRDQAQQEVEDTQQVLRAARQVRDAQAARARLDELRQVHEQLAGFAQQERALAQQIAANTVDDERVARALELESDLRHARGVAQASAPTVQVVRLGDARPRIQRGDQRVDDVDAVDDTTEVSADRDTTITVDGVVSVTVTPGSTARESESAVTAAAARLAEHLAQCGVDTDSGVAQLRRLAADRRDQQAAVQALRSSMAAVLNGRELADVEAEQSQLAAQLAVTPSGEVAETVSVDQAESDHAAAVSALNNAREAVADNENQRRERQIRRDLCADRLASDEERRDHIGQRLAAIADREDAVGDDAVEAAVRQLADAERAVAELERRLRAEGAESVGIELANLRRAEESRQAAAKVLADEVNSLRIELDIRGDDALFDRLSQAQSACADAQERCVRVRERAVAAATLLDALESHRDDARARYVAPFTQQVERLGRIVFGEDVRIEVSAELEIVSRTLGGVTVGYDDLSGGAKEQLAILTRLACALLVDSADGVPVIIDDALGYSDPQRLRAMNAALGYAASDAQVIVLTCTPDRYRNVGGAHLIAV